MVMVDLASDHRQIAQQILFFPTEERTARELEQLPKEAREQVWADMTGHPESIDYRIQAEDPAFLHLRFQDLAKELECRSCKRDAAAYRMAVQHDADYVNQQKLKFLRADNFESAAAAIRMIAHYQMKMDLFGSENLGRDIRLDDLSPDDLESLRAGGMQLLPLQDHAGRGVLFSRHANYVYKDHKNLVRHVFSCICILAGKGLFLISFIRCTISCVPFSTSVKSQQKMKPFKNLALSVSRIK